MLSWALLFLVIALFAALLGFTEIPIVADGAQILFFVFIILFAVTMIVSAFRSRPNDFA